LFDWDISCCLQDAIADFFGIFDPRIDGRNDSDEYPLSWLKVFSDFPAVRTKPASAEVIEFYGLFSSLVNAAAPPDYRLWFVEGVLVHVTSADKARWETALAVHIFRRGEN
jgi:hypothetical protein